MFKRMKMKGKILSLVGSVIIISLVLMTSIIYIESSATAKNMAYKIAEETANRHGLYVRAEVENAMGVARTLAQSFRELKTSNYMDRDFVINTMKYILEQNPQLIGIWTVWEPDAFDGKDQEFINAFGHDETGRFYPYCNRGDGEISIRPVISIPEEEDWYIIPKSTKEEKMIDPYYENVGGKEILITSITVPIIHNGDFLGVVGVDISLDTFQALIHDIKPFETGYSSLISNNGTYIAHIDPKELGKDIGNTKERIEAKKAIREGEIYKIVSLSDTLNRDVYKFFTPINIGKTKTPWSFVVSIPMEKILEPSNEIRNYIIMIGTISFILVMIALFFIMDHMMTPIVQISHMLKELALGRVHFIKKLKITSEDEIGEMNHSFERLVESFEEVTDVCMAVANGDFRKTIPLRSEEDRLGIAVKGMTNTLQDTANMAKSVAQGDYSVNMKVKGKNDLLSPSLNQMIESLRQATTQSEKDNWLKTGKNELNDKMRSQQDMATLSQRIISQLAKTLDAQVGAIYLANENNLLKLIGSYAYRKRKNLSNAFEVGEGLVGQAALEKERILITNVPDEYIHIQSGLGEAEPKNICVIPCIYDGKVKAVIELGSFHSFTDLQLEFLEQVSESIAITLNGAQTRSVMEKLLAKTQHQAEELQVQQEELMETNRELEEQTQALKASEARLQQQQEELSISHMELEERTADLERQRNAIKTKNEELNRAREEIEERVREMERVSKYKSQFLANMSHELRTPLNSILILSQILSQNKDKNLTKKQVEFTKTIHGSGSDLLNLINDILDLSKVEAGKMEIYIEDFPLLELTEDIKGSFMPQASKKGVDFRINIEEGLPESVATDRKRLKQILTNFLSNAFKFTEKGQIAMDIYRPKVDGEVVNGNLDFNKCIAIAISDTGIGISKDQQKVIFEAFQQADGTTSRKYGGTGLGLSISKELAKLLGGAIKIESVEGKGSTFTLYLPQTPLTEEKNLLKVKNEEKRVVKLNEERNIEDDRKHMEKEEKSILIIDDDLDFSKILMELAHKKDFKCILAQDGEQGIQFAQHYNPRAIILDINLPGIDGWEVMEQLKNHPKTCQIPVHFISVEDMANEALKMGAIGYITKPVTVEKMDEAFSKIEEKISKPIKKLLVVEDDENQRKSIVELVRGEGVLVTEAASGEEAYHQLKKEDFDCIIFDLTLGNTSALDLLEKIQKDKDISNTPIIIHTGKELTQEEEIKLQKYVKSIIIKGSKSPERLLAETTLFLHSVDKKIPEDKEQMIRMANKREERLREKKILLVDDDMRNVFALSHLLEEKGMDIIIGRNGKEGIEKLRENPDTDLVMMDIMMPEMDGYEAIRQIRLDENFNKLPIIALTAKAMKDDKKKCIEAGANDYLSKPVDIQKLLSLLRVWLH